MNEKTITQQDLLNAFDYHEDGYFIRKISTYKKDNAGTRVGGVPNKRGYKRISILNIRMREHRAIFLWHYGYLPEIVDHINNNPSDNRIENLRAATNSENLCNRGHQKNSSTKIKNIYLTRNNTYNVQIKKNNVINYIGTFKTLDDALEAKIKYLNVLHGEFACIN
jgi:hypothetical protein